MRKCSESRFCAALRNSIQKQGLSIEAFKQRNSTSDLCFQKPALLQEEWSELHLTPPGQQQFKAQRSRRPVATMATRESAVHLGQTPDATAPKHSQARSLWRAEPELAFRKLTPGMEASPERKVVPSFSLPARRPMRWLHPTSLGSSPLRQLTQERPHLTGRFRVRGSEQPRTSLFTDKQLLCAE